MKEFQSRIIIQSLSITDAKFAGTVVVTDQNAPHCIFLAVVVYNNLYVMDIAWQLVMYGLYSTETEG